MNITDRAIPAPTESNAIIIPMNTPSALILSCSTLTATKLSMSTTLDMIYENTSIHTSFLGTFP